VEELTWGSYVDLRTRRELCGNDLHSVPCHVSCLPAISSVSRVLLVDYLQILVEPQSEVVPPLNTFHRHISESLCNGLLVRAWYRDVDVLLVRKGNKDRILAVLSMSAYMRQ
jgi:hypothetical protein